MDDKEFLVSIGFPESYFDGMDDYHIADVLYDFKYDISSQFKSSYGPDDEIYNEIIKDFEYVTYVPYSNEVDFDSIDQYTMGMIIFKQKSTGKHFAAEAQNDSWSDDGTFGEGHEIYEVEYTEKTVKFWTKKDT